jgi:nicotinamide-nucleotide amidase
LNDRELTALANQVVEVLRARDVRLVLAESCTGGLAAALLARIPGVSEFLCGSSVVYQVETKAQWLRVSRRLLRDPGPVSREVASAMAAGALLATPQADVSAAVTGHLGPGAPLSQDGLVFLAFSRRTQGKPPRIAIKRLELSSERGDCGPLPVQDRRALKNRLRRQRSAAVHLLDWIRVNLSTTSRR